MIIIDFHFYIEDCSLLSPSTRIYTSSPPSLQLLYRRDFRAPSFPVQSLQHSFIDGEYSSMGRSCA
jgi:hypothetical protein